jgi:hypothetical protein
MARMVPDLSKEELEEIDSRAERKLYQQFKDVLDDHYLVIFQPRWILKKETAKAQDGEIDFLIAHPDYGIFSLEVKGGGVASESGKWFSIDRHGVKHDIRNPFTQSMNAKYSIKRKLEESSRAVANLNKCSFGHAVFFPDVKSSELFHSPDTPAEIIGSFASLEDVSTWVKGVFSFWENLTDSPLGKAGIELLCEQLMPTLRAEIVFAATLNRIEEKRFKLTNNQIQILDFLASRRRVSICGGAGTGKTILAMEKAKRLASDGFRTLLTCYNRPLSDWISSELKDFPNIIVSNFDRLTEHFVSTADHKLKKDCLSQAKITYPGMDLWRVQMPAAMTFALEYIDERFDAIVVDEAQDFPDEYWFPLELLLDDPSNSPFYIFYDVHQNLYQRSLQFPIVDVPFELASNCRNTIQIHDFAYKNYSGPKVNKPDLAGNPVQIIMESNQDKQLEKITRLLVDILTKKGVNSSQVVVLIGDNLVKHSKYEMLRNFTLPNGIVWSIENGFKVNHVLVDTVKRFKGLEADIVILWGLPDSESKELQEVLYVGSSRAKSELIIVAGNDSKAALNIEVR